MVLSSGQRLASRDIEAAVSALLASHHSTARPLDSSPMPLTVSVTLHVVRVTIDEPHSRKAAVQEYVQVFIHPLERTVSRGGYDFRGSSTPSRASPLLSAFDTATAGSASTIDSAERRSQMFSPGRIDSNGSGAMPVVSLRGACPICPPLPSSCMPVPPRPPQRQMRTLFHHLTAIQQGIRNVHVFLFAHNVSIVQREWGQI